MCFSAKKPSCFACKQPPSSNACWGGCQHLPAANPAYLLQTTDQPQAPVFSCLMSHSVVQLLSMCPMVLPSPQLLISLARVPPTVFLNLSASAFWLASLRLLAYQPVCSPLVISLSASDSFTTCLFQPADNSVDFCLLLDVSVTASWLSTACACPF
jgi:hypothetical protein